METTPTTEERCAKAMELVVAAEDELAIAIVEKNLVRIATYTTLVDEYQQMHDELKTYLKSQ
jgi:acyl carrier protein|tara:strand:- start:8908 stop:9093 length:186 start_codon:yes stop_codon:yes gene_type:complete